MVPGNIVKVCAATTALLTLGIATASHTNGMRLTSAPKPAQVEHGTVPPMVVGMNMGGLNYFTPDWPFSDIIQSSGTLRYGWAKISDQIQMDATGHPKNVPAGTLLHIALSRGVPLTSSERFQCRTSPGWAARPISDWTMRGSAPNFEMEVGNPEHKITAINIEMVAKSANVNLTEMSCKPVGAKPNELFNPVFLADNQPYRVIRFLNWMQTNGAPYSRWSERATPAFFSQAETKGVALEHMVALANQLHADPWFTLPFDTDPNYYREFAIYVRDHLSPDRKAYVELSNEVWNTAFPQGKEATSLGQSRYPDVSADIADDWYYGDRVRDCMATWSVVYKGQEHRIVRVLSTQQALPRRAEQALSHNDTWRSVDALATSAYFGTRGFEYAQVGPERVNAIFADGPKFIDKVLATAHGNKDVATKYHLRYVAYEGGPGFEAYQPPLAADFLAVQRDPRMHGLYTQFLKRWQSEIGDLFVAFDEVGPTFWAHRTYTGQPLADAPKARALAEFSNRK